MIPIISYLAQRGRCKYCKVSISPHYLFLEIICGLVLLSLYFKFPFLIWLENGTAIPDINILIQYIFFTIYCSIFVGIFFYDLQTSRIPDLFLFPLIGVGVIGSLIIGNPPITSILIAVVIALVFFGGQILVSKGKWLGEGDVYFAVGLAVILGWQLFLVAIVASYMLGALISIPLLIFKKTKIKSSIPFGPFLVLGSFVTIFFGEDILSWYLNTIFF
jgi:leader peptidase (prepilin peptidase)/N-methyltransferase